MHTLYIFMFSIIKLSGSCSDFLLHISVLMVHFEYHYYYVYINGSILETYWTTDDKWPPSTLQNQTISTISFGGGGNALSLKDFLLLHELKIRLGCLPRKIYSYPALALNSVILGYLYSQQYFNSPFPPSCLRFHFAIYIVSLYYRPPPNTPPPPSDMYSIKRYV